MLDPTDKRYRDIVTLYQRLLIRAKSMTHSSRTEALRMWSDPPPDTFFHLFNIVKVLLGAEGELVAYYEVVRGPVHDHGQA